MRPKFFLAAGHEQLLRYLIEHEVLRRERPVRANLAHRSNFQGF
jgi:hypothetical protein